MRTVVVLLAVGLALSIGAMVSADQGQTRGFIVKIQDLDLTDAEEAKIANIRKENRPKFQQAAKALGDLVKEEMEKLSAVITPEQKQKFRAWRDDREERREECLAHSIANLKDLDLTDAEMAKIGEIRKEFKPKFDKAAAQLDGLFTEAQKKLRTDAVSAGNKRRDVLQTLKLTDDQKYKLETVSKELRGLFRGEMEKVRDVLSEAQMEKLEDMKDERREHVRHRMAHRIANLKDLNLNDEQETKLAAIRQEFRPKVHAAGNRLRAAVQDEVERIVAVIKQ